MIFPLQAFMDGEHPTTDGLIHLNSAGEQRASVMIRQGWPRKRMPYTAVLAYRMTSTGSIVGYHADID